MILSGPPADAAFDLVAGCLLEELALPRVDQVKIDVEGAELEGLKAGRKMLRDFRDFLSCLFVECYRILSEKRPSRRRRIRVDTGSCRRGESEIGIWAHSRARWILELGFLS